MPKSIAYKNQPEYYKDAAGQWRWKITAGNNERTHASTEGFTTKTSARENFELLLDDALALHRSVETTQPVADGVVLERMPDDDE